MSRFDDKTVNLYLESGEQESHNRNGLRKLDGTFSQFRFILAVSTGKPALENLCVIRRLVA